MNRLTAALLLLASTAPALAAEEGPDSATDKDRTRYEYAVRAVGGYFDGMGVRTDSGGVGIVELDLTPKLHVGEWAVELPLRLDHRQTFGADLNETIVGAELDMMKRGAGGVRHGPLAGASYTWRPNWPDLYQRTQAGEMTPTDRYSHFQGFLGWQYWNRLGEGRNLRAKLRYIHTVYPRDPNYDEAESVVHLAPRDNGTVRLDTSYRAVKKGYAYAVKLDGYFRQDLVVLAKNANTGGTTSTNPEQRLVGVEPQAELELRTGPIDTTLGYGFLVRKDLHEGYYSYTGHRPYAEVQIAINGRLSVELRAEARLITFGPDSKEDTEDGKTLEDTRYELKGGLRYRVAKALFLVADASWTQRDTNFRDYGPDASAPDGWYPGNYDSTNPRPADRYYDIAWDYTNVMATAGVEWKP